METIIYRGPKKIEKLGERLGENEERIQALIIEYQTIPFTDIAEKIGIGTTVVENNIKELIEKGLLDRKGPAKEEDIDR